MSRRGVNSDGKEDPVRVLALLTVRCPIGRGDSLVPGPISVRRTGIDSFVRIGANVLGRLGVDQCLQVRVQQLAHVN